MLRVAATSLARRTFPRAAPLMGGGALLGSAWLLKPGQAAKCEVSHEALAKTLVFTSVEADVDTASGEVAIGKVGSGSTLAIAKTGSRVKAALIDGAVAIGPCVLFVGGLKTGLLGLVGGCIFYVKYYCDHHATFGKHVMGIKQVTILQKKGEWVLKPISYIKFALNQLFRQIISGITGGLNLFVPLIDAHGQFLSDKAFGIYTVDDAYWKGKTE